MKIADRLPEKQKQQLEKMNSSKKKKRKRKNNNPQTKKKKEEKLSFRDYEDLMGTNRQVLHRKRGGAWGN